MTARKQAVQARVVQEMTKDCQNSYCALVNMKTTISAREVLDMTWECRECSRVWRVTIYPSQQVYDRNGIVASETEARSEIVEVRVGR